MIRVYQGLCPDVRSSEYQLAGPKLHRRAAIVDLGACPDPKAWLEKRLGPLSHFELAVDPVGIAIAAYALVALLAGEGGLRAGAVASSMRDAPGDL